MYQYDEEFVIVSFGPVINRDWSVQINSYTWGNMKQSQEVDKGFLLHQFY
jgi:hypothetical protein